MTRSGLVLLAFLAFPLTAAADEEARAPRWSVQVDPLTVVLGFSHVQVERALGDQFSVYAGPSIRLWDLALEEDDPSYYGLGVEVGLRWYFRGGAPVGTWLMVRGVLAHLRTENSDTAIGGYTSALIGHKFLFGGKWSLSAGIGVSYFEYTVDGVGTEGVLPAAHTTVGYVW